MKKLFSWLCAVPLVAALVGAPLVVSRVARANNASPGAESTRVGSAEDFMPLYRVLLSPRCVNCHPAGDAPTQGDNMSPHAMNVSRVSHESGLSCTTCHRLQNSPLPHGPPGATNWHMPPREMPMVFEGRTPAALCAQLKDPKQNGGKSMNEMVEHMDHDAIVLWGWAPGGARTLPPLAHDKLMEHVNAWARAGAPCPTPGTP